MLPKRGGEEKKSARHAARNTTKPADQPYFPKTALNFFKAVAFAATARLSRNPFPAALDGGAVTKKNNRPCGGNTV